jgi:MOSC domain-containing protein YiiM
VGHGVEGDSHAGLGQREVSLLGIEAVEELSRVHGVQAGPGSFAENITTRNVDLVSLPIGARLAIGEAVLEVVEIGKPPRQPTLTASRAIRCCPRTASCRVVRAGRVRSGDAIRAVAAGTP